MSETIQTEAEAKPAQAGEHPAVLRDIAESIRCEHAEALEWGKRTVEHAGHAVLHAVRCGELLIQAKSMVPHGDWMLWVECNCPDLHHNTVLKYMKAAKLYAAKSHEIVNGSLDAQCLTRFLGCLPSWPEHGHPTDHPTEKRAGGWSSIASRLEAIAFKQATQDEDLRHRLKLWGYSFLEQLGERHLAQYREVLLRAPASPRSP